MKLLTEGASSPKLIKSDKSGLGFKSAILYLLPHSLSGHNVCPFASTGCKATCLNYSGRGRTHVVQKSRLNKTSFFFEEREKFKEQLDKEIDLFVKKTKKQNLTPAIRLNGISDLAVEQIFADILAKNPDVVFYDYTKNPKRYQQFLSGKLPSNYYLTFSRSENNEKQCQDFLNLGGNVAVVFRTKEFPKKYLGHPVFSMEETDLRFLDKKGVGALYAKGKAKHDKTGFVVDAEKII